MAFQQYRRTQIAKMEPWGEGYDMTHVSVSAPDKEAGSPKPGPDIHRFHSGQRRHVVRAFHDRGRLALPGFRAR